MSRHTIESAQLGALQVPCFECSINTVDLTSAHFHTDLSEAVIVGLKALRSWAKGESKSRRGGHRSSKLLIEHTGHFTHRKPVFVDTHQTKLRSLPTVCQSLKAVDGEQRLNSVGRLALEQVVCCAVGEPVSLVDRWVQIHDVIQTLWSGP